RSRTQLYSVVPHALPGTADPYTDAPDDGASAGDGPSRTVRNHLDDRRLPRTLERARRYGALDLCAVHPAGPSGSPFGGSETLPHEFREHHHAVGPRVRDVSLRSG